ncbi:unnamed protein product, partial [Brassica oleracea var. botrytis]
LNGFKSLSFPSLKIMFLEDVGLPSDAAAEELISCSPVLQVLKICLCKYDSAVALRVCSLSLKSFTLKRMEPRYSRGHSVIIYNLLKNFSGNLCVRFTSLNSLTPPLVEFAVNKTVEK